MADILILVLVVLSTGVGVWRGLVKEAMSLVTWLAAIWFGWRFSWLADGLLGRWLDAPELQLWLGRFLIFLTVLVLGALVSSVVSKLVRYSPLSGSDRVLGALFGFGRGALVVGLASIVVDFGGFSNETWWQRSVLRPYGEQIGSGIRYYTGLGGEYLKDNDLISTRAGPPPDGLDS